jgi:hypothetical protein
MAISRRKFMKAGTLVILSAGVPLKVVAENLAGPVGPHSIMGGHLGGLHFLTEASFAAQLNSTFNVSSGASETVKMRLVEVSDLRTAAVKKSPAMRGRECFSTVFLGPRKAPLKQDTYTVEHTALGKFPVLIVPVGESEQGLYYEAIFNRLY